MWIALGTLLQIAAFFLVRREPLESVGAVVGVFGTSVIAVGMWILLGRSGRSLAWCLLCFLPLVALASALIWIPKSLGEDDDSAA
jgi:hypothetical protein